jgi:hypothetical protein
MSHAKVQPSIQKSWPEQQFQTDLSHSKHRSAPVMDTLSIHLIIFPSILCIFHYSRSFFLQRESLFCWFSYLSADQGTSQRWASQVIFWLDLWLEKPMTCPSLVLAHRIIRSFFRRSDIFLHSSRSFFLQRESLFRWPRYSHVVKIAKKSPILSR